MNSAFPPAPDAPPRIAILGGGISGLAAAYRLAELLPKAELSLFEASDRLGGVLHTVERDGFLIEQSADNFLVKPPAGIELCRQLGIADELLTTDESRRRAFVVRAGKLIPIPEGFYLMSPRKLWPFLTSPALSLAGKLRLLAEPFISRGPASSLNPEPRTLNPQPDESVASFARRRLGRQAYERLVQPLVAGIYTADPEQLSMAAAMPQFLEFERAHGSLLRATLFSRGRIGRFSDQSADEATQSSDAASGARYGLFVAPKCGMTSLVNALADRLPSTAIHLNTPVTRITRFEDNRWHLDFTIPDSPLRTPHSAFDALIL
ncbi:MAG: protoporphyrinogen oxidase, partial [Pirellulales bacterium]